MNTFTQSFIVNKSHAANVVGSGSLEVLSTPAMIAFIENTAIKSIKITDEKFTTVGIEINVKHLKASKIGEEVKITSELISQTKHIYEFEIIVRSSKGDIIGTATHKRAIVEIDRFLRKLGE